MRRYLLDSNILVHYARQSTLYRQIEATERLSSPDCMAMISVVTYGEIMSFGIQHNWGAKKITDVQLMLSKIIIIDINSGDLDLLKAYADIDAFSKNKLPGNPLGRSVKMGKNDLWIAATAKVANATLLTTDSDFEHLHEIFLQVRKY